MAPDPEVKADAADRAKRTGRQGLESLLVLELINLTYQAIEDAGDVTLVDWSALARPAATVVAMVVLSYLRRRHEG